MKPVVQRFTETYAHLNAQSLDLLRDLYSDDVQFEDPFRQIGDLSTLTAYFAQLYDRVESISFLFRETFAHHDSAMLAWTMSLRHPRLNCGHQITVAGSSHIRFRDKVTYHRDYFDAAAMLYEHLPVIGIVVRAIKARV